MIHNVSILNELFHILRHVYLNNPLNSCQ